MLENQTCAQEPELKKRMDKVIQQYDIWDSRTGINRIVYEKTEAHGNSRKELIIETRVFLYNVEWRITKQGEKIEITPPHEAPTLPPYKPKMPLKEIDTERREAILNQLSSEARSLLEVALESE